MALRGALEDDGDIARRQVEPSPAPSLGISSVSQLSTPWALAAIAWGAGFIVAGEAEAWR